MKKQEQSTRETTGHEVRQALGAPADDTLVAEILRTGASPAEILEAREWLDDDDYMGGDMGRSMGVRVRAVHEVLQRERDRFESRDR